MIDRELIEILRRLKEDNRYTLHDLSKKLDIQVSREVAQDGPYQQGLRESSQRKIGPGLKRQEGAECIFLRGFSQLNKQVSKFRQEELV